MNRLHSVLICLIFFGFIFGISLERVQADEKSTVKRMYKYDDTEEKRQDVVLRGDSECTFCHEEEDSPALLRIGKTKHGTVADKRTPTCTSCHGSSRNHLKKPEGQDRPPPDITFPKRNPSVMADYTIDPDFGQVKLPKTAVATMNGMCLKCHKENKLMFWASSAHSTQDVACTSCHELHTSSDRVMHAIEQPKVCFTCHKTQRALFQRPSHHPVPEGQMVCSDCHNPHGSSGLKSLKKDNVNETCYQCHMEKRGPFLHMHPPVAEDCRICHNPHGTTVAGLLVSRPPYLCQECHSSSSHRSQVASLPGSPSTNPQLIGTVARGCLKCHTNIHGGNSSENVTRGGRYFR